jgi:WD40 repeat protein
MTRQHGPGGPRRVALIVGVSTLLVLLLALSIIFAHRSHQPLRFRADAGAVSALRFTTDGELLISASGKGDVALWSLDDRDARKRWDAGPFAQGPILGLDVNMSEVACSGEDGVVHLLDIGSGRERRSTRAAPGDRYVVTSLAFSPSSDLLAIGTEDVMGARPGPNGVLIWNFTGSVPQLTQVPGSAGYSGSLQWLVDGKSLAALDAGGETIGIFDASSMCMLHSISVRPLLVKQLGAAEGCRLVSGGTGGLVLWNAKNPVSHFQIADTGIERLVSDRAARFVCALDSQNRLSVWDLREHQCVWTRAEVLPQCTAIALSSATRRVAVGRASGEILVYRW